MNAESFNNCNATSLLDRLPESHLGMRDCSEMSEAINSMWTWYLNCPLCLAYDIVGDQQGAPDGYVEKLNQQ
jgi:hypothetical protein